MKNITNIIRKGEGTTVEFKLNIVSFDILVVILLSLANTHGGYLIIGCDDRGKFMGITTNDILRIKKYISRLEFEIPFNDNLKIESDILSIGDRYILCLHVLKVESQIPYQGYIYYRCGDSTKKYKRSSESIDVRRQQMPVIKILKWLEEGKIRRIGNNNRWTDEAKKSLFIESLLASFPISTLLIDGSQKKWNILQGSSEIGSIEDFVKNVFCLSNVTYIDNAYNGLTYSQLPGRMKNRLNDYMLDIIIVNQGTPQPVIDEIKRRFKLFK